MMRYHIWRNKTDKNRMSAGTYRGRHAAAPPHAGTSWLHVAAEGQKDAADDQCAMP